LRVARNSTPLAATTRYPSEFLKVRLLPYRTMNCVGSHCGSRLLRTAIVAIGALLIVSASTQPGFSQEPKGCAAPDDVVAVKRFHKELGCNFLAMWTSENLIPLAIGTGATLAGSPADDNVAAYFSAEGRWGSYDSVGKQLGKTYVIGPAVGLAFLASRATDNEKFQRFSYSLAQGFVITNGITGGIKVAANRTRPDGSDQRSFLSGHTSNSFVVASVMAHHYGWKAGVPAFAVAAYVGSTRFHSRKHFVTDVAAGATLGFIIGRTVSKRYRGDRDSRVSWGAGVAPGGGVALTLRVRPW